jgi:hypothetical protein
VEEHLPDVQVVNGSIPLTPTKIMLIQLDTPPDCAHNIEDYWCRITMEWGGKGRIEYHCCGSVFDKTGFLGVDEYTYNRWLERPPRPELIWK